jgi:hypothetical protein
MSTFGSMPVRGGNSSSNPGCQHADDLRFAVAEVDRPADDA